MSEEVVDRLEARVRRVGTLIEELKSKSEEDEIVDQVAEELFRSITELDNEVIEEMVEDYLAARGIGMPAVRDWDSDESVTQEYLRYEQAQRQIYRLAWLATAKKLMDAYAETER
jgi:restriction endonuclease Mrr